VLVLTHKSHSKSPGRSAASSSSLTNHRRAGSVVSINPSTVTVSVLNGTDLTGLAGRVSDKLATKGFQKGAVTDASSQTQTTSLVEYASPSYRADALAVASTLNLHAGSVQAVDSGTQRIACSQSPKGCHSAVYVTVGSDLSAQ
jgi:LytR cell envelope-related transcriptional attenuator